ncbi:MAG: penicillin acylase family protein [Bacteroidales bacterium]
MKTLKIILLSVVVLIIAAIAIGLIIIKGISRGALPLYNGEITLEGLTDDVTVYRDERGMPHIYASCEHDLYFATGYIMAQERLWQMDLIRRATTGRLSEIFGEDYVQTDLFLRCLDMTSKSEKVIKNTSPEILFCLQAFVNGVNEYIKHSGKKLPPEFRILAYKPDPWTLLNVANIIGYMGWDLASDNLYSDICNYGLVKKVGSEKAITLIPDWKAECTVVFPDFRLDDHAITKIKEFAASYDNLKLLGLSAFTGSNNWAVSGTRTTTGKPVMCNDMHLSFGSPGIWIQMHQIIPGKLNVTGVVVPGEPFVVAGHNEHIAWGLTNLMVDDIDLFAETINTADTNQYLFNSEWINMKVRNEVIKIKGGRDTTCFLRFTHRGPVISGFENVGDTCLAMRWSGYDESNEVMTVYMLNRASDFDQFRHSISHFRSISQNFVYADTEGSIGLNTGGGIPVRKGPGTIIRNGETDEWDWKGYVPFEELPSAFNPPAGHVSSANNKTVGDDYPYYISSEFALPYRINRIRQMLDEKEVFSMEDFKRMITDQHSDYAARLTPMILKVLENKTDFLNDLELKALASLRMWDYDMNKDLIAPSIFEFFRFTFPENLLADELEEFYESLVDTHRDYYIYRIITEGPDEWVDNVKTGIKESLDDIIFGSFRDCISEITAKYGADTAKWKWGDIHRIIITHPLGTVKILDGIFRFNSKEYRVGGSNHTVSPYSYKAGFVVNHGASERHIYNTANWDESLTVIPTGNSGIPASEFYLSQTDDYINCRFYRDLFSEPAVKAAAKYKLLLKPLK